MKDVFKEGTRGRVWVPPIIKSGGNGSTLAKPDGNSGSGWRDLPTPK